MDRRGAFARAAMGVFALIVSPASVDDRERREVRAQGGSLEALLAAWISECLYVHEIEGFAVREVDVSVCTDSIVHGFLRGEALDPARHGTGTSVKTAASRRVSVSEADGRVEISFVVEV